MSTHRWSEPVECLLGEGTPACDVLVIGSGYGGSMAAAQLADGARSVWVLERGREYALGEFPQDIGQLPGHVRLERNGERDALGRPDALYDIRSFDDGVVLAGSGLGGGSLINAGVALQPSHAFFKTGNWPTGIREMEDSERDDLFRKARELIGAAPLPQADELPKFQALARLAAALGATAEALPIQVAGEDVPADDQHPVKLDACIRCGNCFTGCNYGAKRTLATNLIPMAAKKGARFLTGAFARSIEVLDGGGTARYRVHFELVGERGDERTPKNGYAIDARTLIVSAGTLGTAELLRRSAGEAAGQLRLSRHLGERFSANGDTIVMGWGQRQAVHGFAHLKGGAPARVGPTITGGIRTQVRVGNAMRDAWIQDGAVPQALARSAVALGSTLSLFHRYLGTDLPGFYADRSDKDWVATPGELRDHAQLLLGMGADGANGFIEWKDDRLQVRWPEEPAGPGFDEALHGQFVAAGRAGFDGGDYLANPLWRALPDDFAQVAGKGAQGGRRITVHPLGGCAMGDDAAHGVVDQHGTVFRADEGVYEGLHVLDGSIIPCATIDNPLLTISALALRAASHIASELGGTPGDEVPVGNTQPAVTPLLASDDGGIELEFRETLFGKPDAAAPGWLLPLLQHRKLGAWIAVVRVQVPLDPWLANPSMPLEASLQLWAGEKPVGLAVDPKVFEGAPLLEGQGTVTLLAADVPNLFEKMARLWEANACFRERRPGETDYVNAIQHPGAAIATALNHTTYRELRYHFRLHPPDAKTDRYTLDGTKKLAYARGGKNLWDALLQLPLQLRQDGASDACGIALAVDLEDMIGQRRLQVKKASNTPAAIVGLAAFAAQWARALVQTHFWSFRGLTYEKLPPRPDVAGPGEALPLPRVLEGCRLETFKLPVSSVRSSADPVCIELHRYAQAQPRPDRCILMIHGGAHGTGVFTTQTIDCNMAQHFLREGYTVWLLDHRLSNRLPYADQMHTIDDVARLDVTPAVDRVFDENGREPFQVFAHCVGAAAFAMAVLKGWLQRDGASMVRAATIHGVHPWVVPSGTNRTSAAMAALYKDLLPEGLKIDAIPPTGTAGAMDEVIDRIAATLPWPDGERADHERGRLDHEAGYAICNRMTLFYGREWRHGNLDPRTHGALGELVGIGGLEMFRQLFFLALRQRLTTRGGENEYLTSPNVLAYWTFPTLFAHGSDNRVFDVRSAFRAWKRMTMVQTGRDPIPPVHLFVPRNEYGHMDFLFGKDAEKDVYPDLSAFFANPSAFLSTVQGRYVTVNDDGDKEILIGGVDVNDHQNTIPRKPICGPMVQVEGGAGKPRRLILWCEQAVDATSQLSAPCVWVGRWLDKDEYTPLPSAPSGAGVCWTLVIPESDRLNFAAAKRIGIRLNYQGEVPMTMHVLSGLQRRELADGVAFREDDVPAERLERIERSDRVQRPHVVPITRAPWWKRWVTEGRQRPGVTAFLAASCRWPGMPFERNAVHAIARPMLAHVQPKDGIEPAQGLVLLGDQVYVDATANVAETTEPGERGPQRYRDAWDPRSAAGKLLARVPCWFVVDDHEFGDNVSEFGNGIDDKLLTDGFAATAAYQWRHSGGRPARAAEGVYDPDVLGPAARGFWYEFSIGGIPAFAADTRTERQPRNDLADVSKAAIMGAKQARRLATWLLRHRDEPKILCSGSVFGLPTRRCLDEHSQRRYADDWCGYPASMERLTRFIVANRIRNVVFLSGDYHLSAMAKLTLEVEGERIEAASVVCSGWNASLPFANAHSNEYTWDKAVALESGRSRIISEARLMSDALRQFSKVTITRDPAGGCTICAEVFDSEGGLLNAPMAVTLP